MMGFFNAMFQAVVQGLTEFLPVSSSGHLQLVQHFTAQGVENIYIFSVIVHLGTFFAIIIAFRERVWALCKEFCSAVVDIFTLKFSFKNMNGNRRMLVMMVISLAMLLPAYPFKHLFEQQAHFIMLGICFMVTSVLLFVSDKIATGRKTAEDINYKNALTIGIMQAVAIMPGISRSGSTTSAGLICGFNRNLAVEYAFILGLPTIFVGAVFELKDFFAEGAAIPVEGGMLTLILAFFIAMIVGVFAIKMVSILLNKNKFKIFAWYTGILGIVVLVIGIIEIFKKAPLFQI